jgi:riboflavin synthase
VERERFTVTLIPHTLGATTLDLLQVDAIVNIEVDLVARYLERLLTSSGTRDP